MKTKITADEMKAVQRENQTNIYLKRIEQLLLNNSNVPRTPEDIESRRNELGFFKDDITGNQLDDPETYLVSGKFFTNLRFAHIIQEDNPVIIIETVQQAKYRLLSKNKRDGETERRRDEEAETKKEPPYFSAIYCDGIVKQYRLKIIKVYEYGQRKIKNPELFSGEEEYLKLYDDLALVEQELKKILEIYTRQIRESCMVPGTRPKDTESEGFISDSYIKGQFQKAKEAKWALNQIFPPPKKAKKKIEKEIVEKVSEK